MLRLKTFKGGVHPSAFKELTQGSPIHNMAVPKKVVIPLSQHVGAPSKALVKKGDVVKTGQKIGQADGFVSLPVHASISGEVTAVGPFPYPLGREAESVVIEGDGTEQWDDNVGKPVDADKLTPGQLRDAIFEAGVAGMGGAAFPTHVKLSPPKEKPIDTVILNGAECEPYLTSDHRLMLEVPEEIIGGLKIVLKILGCQKAYIGIEANKPDAIKTMEEAVRGEENVTVVPLKVKYPQGAEKQLIHAITRREVPSGGLPMDVGCLVQNVGTAAAIYEAVTKNKPLIDRVVTVTGSGVKRPKNLRARIGTPFRDLINECGGYRWGVSKIIMGGPMMGVAQYTDEVSVIKGTSAIVVLKLDHALMPESSPCISCGRCVDSCPINLMPNMIGKLVEHSRFDEAEEYGILDCIECGVCAYVCPSKRNLIHLIKYGKAEILARRQKAKLSTS